MVNNHPFCDYQEKIMPEILKIVQQTKQKFLNMFEFTVQDRSGRVHPYYVASRATEIAGLKQQTKNYNR